jgi:hypothetical protein
MNLSNSSMELNGTLKDLRILWDETKEVWNDGVRQDFEKNQWVSLELRVLGGIRAMERLAPVLEKLQRDCE